MKLKNIGNRIVNVGSTVLTPDSSMEISAEQAKNRSIKAYIRKGFLKLEDSTVEGKAAAVTADAKAADAKTSGESKKAAATDSKK